MGKSYREQSNYDYLKKDKRLSDAEKKKISKKKVKHKFKDYNNYEEEDQLW